MRLRLASVLLPVALWVACENVDSPKQPVWNKQPCEHCHMVLSDPRYAAQLTTQDGRRLYFDDIGCMASYLSAKGNLSLHVWVHVGAAWRDAHHTRYARAAQTPMGFGFVPRANGELDFSAVMRAVAPVGRVAP